MIRAVSLTLLILIVLASGCARSLYVEGREASEQGDYSTALSTLYEAIGEDPGDYRAWNEIGLVHYRQGSLEKAEEAFSTSNKIMPSALSNLYLGLIFEERGETDKAIRVYGAAVNLEKRSKSRRMIEDRLSALIDMKLMNEASLAVKNEKEIDVGSLPDNSIAVVNFDGSALPSELEPLALGMAEFIAMDLAKISSLKVLERVKINVILDELAISKSRYSDTSLAPRVGKLLGSRQMVLGTVTSTGEDMIRMDGKVVNTVSNEVSSTQPKEGALEKFFDVEKDFVFTLIDTLGIELTKAERDAIEEVPTESFLAFMSYSQGLMLQKQGLFEDAHRSFRNAESHDPGFTQASTFAGKMEQSALSGASGSGGQGSLGKVEQRFRSMIRGEDPGSGLGPVQAANLMNSNFIFNNDLYWNFGSGAVAPPGGGSIWTGYGVIVIEGDLDAH